MARTLDSHASAQTAAFPDYEWNRTVHEAYGLHIAAHVRDAGADSVLSLGNEHREVVRPLLDCLANGVLRCYAIVDASMREVLWHLEGRLDGHLA